MDGEVNSEGLRTTALPAASAGAAPRHAWFIGKFQGVTIATTPYGSYRVYVWLPAPGSIVRPWWARTI